MPDWILVLVLYVKVEWWDGNSLAWVSGDSVRNNKFSGDGISSSSDCEGRTMFKWMLGGIAEQGFVVKSTNCLSRSR